MDINETGCESVDWFRLAQDRGHWRGTVMKLGVLLKGVGCVHRLSECQVLKTDCCCCLNQSRSLHMCVCVCVCVCVHIRRRT